VILDFFLINILFAIAGILFVLVSLPLIMGWVQPNRWYGFRTAKTRSSDRLWYAANRAMGYDFLWAGLAMCIGAIGILLMGRSLSIQAAATINLIVMLVALSIAILHSYISLRRL
jgi:uncharacterized membrane protein